MPRFPIEAWAMRHPRARWPLVLALVFVLACLGSADF
jgi:hypothetical protein